MGVLPLREHSLAHQEHQRLDELEAVVERGLGTFVEVGQALMEIRDKRLYRELHDTFEDYCRSRWKMSQPHAQRHINAAQVIGAIPMGIEAPANERQARELAPLLDEPASLAAAWNQAVGRAAALDSPVTAALVREVVEEKRDAFTGAAFSSKTDQWATPQDFFAVLDAEFGFNLDVCASALNAKSKRFFTVEDDGLKQEWTGKCWMNPPYGDEIGRWVKKAYESAQAGALVVCLLPARTDTGWWWDYARYGEVRFLKGRLKFGNSTNSAPFPSAVVIFGKPAKVVWWER
jgi:phage N-6-adenine-methyltransferase